MVHFNRFLPLLILTGLLFGQSLGELILEKDGEQVTIPKGDWVVAINSQDSDIFVGGELLGVNAHGYILIVYTDLLDTLLFLKGGNILVGRNDFILTRESAKDWERSIAIQDIGVLYHGNYKRTSKYKRQGAFYGGAVALGIGILLGIGIIAEGSGIVHGFFNRLGIGIIISGIFTVPAGAAIGFIQGKVAEGKAVEYIIGPDDWQIVHE